ncbi:MAG TPA: ROK family transcriptional regulator [Gaiellaceae bacterium]|nr:ROK family transcriptional regulator [Gaiellaceae bacterium]
MSAALPRGSPSLLRRLNSVAVLRAIRGEGPLSRAELARRTGLSKPTVNDVVEFLLTSGYVREQVGDGEGRPRRPGRRARLLSFRSDLGHVLGIDVGADKVLALVADLDGEVLASERRKTAGRDRRSAKALIGLVEDAARRVIDAAGLRPDGLMAAGVGTPGIVDRDSGRITLAPQLGDWEGIELGPTLERSFGCPVLVENEVRLSLLAERWRGAARTITDAFFVQLGVGIGGGVLIGGEVYRGASGAAGEIGYVPLFSAEPAPDGLGPFEHAAGGAAFARLAREAVAAGDGGALLERAAGNPEAIDAELVFAVASEGDGTAQRIVDQLVERLAQGIAAAVVVLNPSTVIVGGGLSRAGRSLLVPLERRITELVPVAPRVVLSELADGGVALGALRLALQTVEERLFDLAGAQSV